MEDTTENQTKEKDIVPEPATKDGLPSIQPI